MIRVPFVPTLLVGLAVAAMIALGVWQLDVRAPEKAALLVTLAANRDRAPIAYPASGIGDTLLFRRAHGVCARVSGWTTQAGRAADGASGWRQIARCALGTTTPAMIVQLGVSSDPSAHPAWRGGAVEGYLAYAPDTLPAIARAFVNTPRALMLIAAAPAPGLKANPPPDLDAVPNNHVGYAVQWFLFAATAAIIYALALRRRAR